MGDNNLYTIKTGDNFWSLESEWNIPHGTLQKLNSKLDPKILKVGQQIKTPTLIYFVVEKFSNTKKHPYYIDEGNFQTPINNLPVHRRQSLGSASNIGKVNSNSAYDGLGVLEYSDEMIAGIASHTSGLRNGGGYIAYSTAKTGKGLYWKPNARGLNNLKGSSFNVGKGFNIGGTAVGVVLEVPEIYYGYKSSIHEGNKQLVGGVGSVGGGWIGGALAGAGLGLFGIETGPGVIITVIVGAIAGGYYGEKYVEDIYDKITK